MTTFLSILAALLVLSVFVVVHELGHFLAGRLLGFTVLEFAVGMGPAVLKKEKNGILYALRAFPIGGMCRFYGEDEEAKDAKSFASHPVWKRIIVVAAGPIMNILLAILLAMGLLMGYGQYVDIPTIMEDPAAETPAAAAGVMAEDVIVAVNGTEVEYFDQASELILGAEGEEMILTVARDGEEIDLTVRDFYSEAEGRNIIGITYSYGRVRYGFFEALGGSVKFICSLVVEMLRFIGSIFTEGVKQGDVVGPVGTVAIIGQAVRTGFETVLYLSALISVNLAVMNLLPLPALDGGRLVFLFIELVRGKPISQEKEGFVHFAGLVLLLILMVVLVVSDVRGLSSGLF
ncbi:MAG: site-2 protease family protein [Clostridia bacterium]|nr:site-2 protease family protein [Clostridia bacterium]